MISKTNTQRSPGIIFQPHTHRAMQKGITQIVDAVRPTLGPLSRTVLIGREAVDRAPMLFDSAELIAQRIIELPNQSQDMGAMLLRDMLWHLHQEVGDGTATAAVIFEAVFKGGLRYLEAGHNAMQLRRCLEAALGTVLCQLSAMSVPAEGKQKLEQLARSVYYDPPLATLMGEIFNVIGQYGHLEIRTTYGRGLEREYIEGMYWEGGLLTRSMLQDAAKLEATVENAAILISDLPVVTQEDVIPVLELALANRARSLVLVTPQISTQAIAILRANTRPDVFEVLAVKLPGASIDTQMAAMADLAILTGGRSVLKDTGTSLKRIRWEDLGQARRVWADQFFFGVVGGKGNAVALRQHVSALRQMFSQTEDVQLRTSIQQRLGKLMGGAATLWIGGISDTEVKLRADAAERTANVLRGAVSDGVLLGGGIALLACSSALQQKAAQSSDPNECAAYKILGDALQAPFQTLVTNAGYDAGEAIAQLDLSMPNCGFDVVTGQPADMIGAGIFESAAVVKAAVRSAISSGALALTIDVLVHHKKPELVTTT